MYSSMQMQMHLALITLGRGTKSLRQLPSVDEAGGDEIPGRVDEVVEVAVHDGVVPQVDAEQVVVEEEVDDGGVVGVDEREDGDLAGESGGLVGVMIPDVVEAGLVLELPLGGVGIGQRPDGDLESAAGVAVPVHVDEAQLARADPDGAVPFEHRGSLAVAERHARRERDDGEVRVVGEGVAGDDAPGEVDPPEPAVERDDGVGGEVAGRERVVDGLVDPLADVGGEAEEGGVVVAEEGLELGDHVAGAGGGGDDADVAGVQDELGLGEGDRGGVGGVEDEVAGDELAPAEGLVVGAVDDGGGGGAALVGVEEEEARGVGGEEPGEVAGGDLGREDGLGDGEEGDARGHDDVEGEVVGGDARDGAEDDPGGRRRRRRGGRGRHVVGGSAFGGGRSESRGSTHGGTMQWGFAFDRPRQGFEDLLPLPASTLSSSSPPGDGADGSFSYCFACCQLSG